MNFTELKTFIKQHFGYPMVEVELHDTQIESCIQQAYNYHLKWGVGISTKEVFFTKTLSAGVREYDVPDGIHSIIDITDYSSSMGGSQELFTVSNALYMQYQLSGPGFSLIDYTIGMQYLDLVSKFKVSKFAWKYHKFNNTILLSPTPSTTDVTNYNFLLCRSFIEEGYKIDDDTQNPSWKQHLYDDPWFQEYCIALCKIILGHIRRKFENFASLGNTGINLDGDSLLQEGKAEKEALEEALKLETWEGMDIHYD